MVILLNVFFFDLFPGLFQSKDTVDSWSRGANNLGSHGGRSGSDRYMGRGGSSNYSSNGMTVNTLYAILKSLLLPG